MPEYRDIINANIPVDLTRKGQVYQATHKGDVRISLMNRSFISFTYGGKYIEDFNLIATINNNRLDRIGYSPFNDITTSYENLDGQYYWGTHYNPNQMEFTLSTDGIDQKMLDDFLYWFHAGEIRELILAEHPNRATLARVAEPPQLSLLPFEDDVSITINEISYKTKTTLYKGDIQLKLVMDEPHWYAIQNILGRKISEEGHPTRYIDMWKAPNDPDEEQYYTNIFASQDALKILYEDGIPLGSMIDQNMMLGNGALAKVEDNETSQIWSIASDDDSIWTDGVPRGTGARINGTVTAADKEADNKIRSAPGTYYGAIAGAIMNADGQGITSLSSNTDAYFYYSGNAPAFTEIKFNLTPQFNDQGYVICPNNSIVGSNPSYNTIIVESVNQQVLKLTTPNILTSYNKALQIFYKMLNSTEYTWEDVRANIRDSVRHAGVRAWAIKIIDIIKDGETTSGANIINVKDAMLRFLTDTNNTPYTLTLTFNSQYGKAIGKIQYNTPDANKTDLTDMCSEYGKIFEEDVGDMLNSNYIIIRERNYPNQYGRIVGWNNTTEGRRYSHRITHDFSTPLTNFVIYYKNMYL